jgi:putative spermidine/putrescine transport system permease protein
MRVQSKQVTPSVSLALPLLLLFAAFYILPVTFTILLSAGHPPTLSIDPDKLSFSNIQKFLSSDYYLRALLQAILLGAGVGALGVIMGYPVALFLARSTSRFKQPLFYLTLLPMAVGQNVITLGWLVILGRNGVVNSVLMMTDLINDPLTLLYTWGSLVVALVNVLFTFVVLPIAAVLRTIDTSTEQAARNLGAGPVRTFLLITLPLSVEGVAAGFLAVFVQASTALVMPLILGGQRTTILPILVWEQFSVANDRNFSATLSVALLLVALVVLFLQMKLGRLKKAAS